MTPRPPPFPAAPLQFTDAEEEDAADDDDDDIEYINLGDKLVRCPRVKVRVVSRAGMEGAPASPLARAALGALRFSP